MTPLLAAKRERKNVGMTPENGSPSGKFDKNDAGKAFQWSLIVGVTAASQALIDYASKQEYGVWTAAVLAALAAIGAGIARWKKDNTKEIVQ